MYVYKYKGILQALWLKNGKIVLTKFSTQLSRPSSFILKVNLWSWVNNLVKLFARLNLFKCIVRIYKLTYILVLIPFGEGNFCIEVGTFLVKEKVYCRSLSQSTNEVFLTRTLSSSTSTEDLTQTAIAQMQTCALCRRRSNKLSSSEHLNSSTDKVFNEDEEDDELRSSFNSTTIAGKYNTTQLQSLASHIQDEDTTMEQTKDHNDNVCTTGNSTMATILFTDILELILIIFILWCM